MQGAQQFTSALFSSASNAGNPRFGVILRYQDANNYYIVYRMTGLKRLRISKIVNGVETILKSVELTANDPYPQNFPGTMFRLDGLADGTKLTANLFIGAKAERYNNQGNDTPDMPGVYPCVAIVSGACEDIFSISITDTTFTSGKSGLLINAGTAVSHAVGNFISRTR